MIDDREYWRLNRRINFRQTLFQELMFLLGIRRQLIVDNIVKQRRRNDQIKIAGSFAAGDQDCVVYHAQDVIQTVPAGIAG